MNCPRCNNYLAISNTHGIEIDYCPNCKGVWLDRGELEKIIERSNSSSSPFISNTEHPFQHYSNDRHYDSHEKQYDSHGDNKHNYDHSRRKKGFLSELFDF